MWLVATWALEVSLPPEAVSEDWDKALHVAGVDAQEAGSVALTSGPETWTLTVTDATGEVHRVHVAPPTNPADREEIAWLAASLLEARPAPLLPPPPVKPTTTVVVAPPERVEAPAEVVDAPVVLEVPLDEVVAEAAAEGAVLVSVALGISDRAALDVALGVHRGPWWAAFGVRGFESAVDVPDAGMQLARLQLGAQRARGPLLASVGAGTELRQWTAPLAAATWSVMPTATAGLGIPFSLGPVAVVPRLSATADLRPTTVVRGDEVRQQRLHGGLHVVLSRSL
mgnify:CR=1 FL=1